MQPGPALVAAATAAVDLVLPLSHPADAVLREFFAAHRQLGSQDRAFVAETVFAVLRHKRLLEHLLQQLAVQPTPRKLVLAALIKLQGHSLSQLDPVLKSEDRDWAAKLKAPTSNRCRPPVRLSLPDWLYDRIVAEVPSRKPSSSAAQCSSRRRSTCASTRYSRTGSSVLQGAEGRRLRGEADAATPRSASGSSGKPAINRHALFTGGSIEVQDEGSQLLAYLLAPKRREMVVDFCAGAGGKTLALGALMQSQGRLYALDVSEKRLNNLKPRLKRSGLVQRASATDPERERHPHQAPGRKNRPRPRRRAVQRPGHAAPQSRPEVATVPAIGYRACRQTGCNPAKCRRRC